MAPRTAWKPYVPLAGGAWAGRRCATDRHRRDRDPRWRERRPLDYPIASYRWVFGDRTSGTGVRATHVYPAVRAYPVTLIVTDARNLTARVTRIVAIPKSVAVSVAESVGATDAPALIPGVEVSISESPSVSDTVTVVRHPPPAHPHK